MPRKGGQSDAAVELASRFVWVKICGITTEEDALLAVAMGADAVGFVFAPSKRQVTPRLAADIVKRLPPEVMTVGVFRNEVPARVVEIVNRSRLRCAQLHGHENPVDTAYVTERVPRVIKAFAAGSLALERAQDYRAHAILVDSPIPGSGEVFDWSLAEGAPLTGRVILAGGLGPDNVGEAIAKVKPWGVDVSSGVESAPGRKDARKLRDFIAAAKTVTSTPAPADGGSDGPFDWQED